MFTTLVSATEMLECTRPLIVVDCRFDLADPAAGERAHAAGHIPGALYAHLDRDLAGPLTPQGGRHPLPDPRVFAQRLGAWGIGTGIQVIAYDDSGGAYAARLWWLLRWLGHQAVAVLDGGYRAWLAASGPVETGIRAAVSRSFVPNVDDHAAVDAATLLASLPGRRLLIVDARTEERFAGRVEPIDPVAGHIPGAVSAPFTGNLDADGRFLPAAALATRWSRVLAGRRPRDVVAMCGSGVTACQNLLAMEVAGLRGARLYAGSWSEWIRDPARPVARDPVP